jgi:glycerate-2-kinase
MSGVRGSRSDAVDIFNAGVRAAQMPGLTGAFGAPGCDALTIAGLEIPVLGLERVVVVAAGKAARELAARVTTGLRHALPSGCAIVGYELVPERHPLDSIPTDPTVHARIELEELAVRPADSNVATERGVAATERVLRRLRVLGDESLVVCAFTGGGSATLTAPAPGLSLADTRRAVEWLTHDGATIEEINTLRRHVSAVKGGRLAQAAAGARAVVSLLVSDVDGDVPHVIASGPAVPDPTTFRDALDLREEWPESVLRHLQAGARGELPDTPDVLPVNVAWEVIRSPDDALAGAGRRAFERGWRVELLQRPTPSSLGACLDAHLQAVHRVAPGTAIVSVGEAPLELPAEAPDGGRAGHLALALGMALDADPMYRGRATVLVGATDGEDGTSCSSGGVVDVEVLRHAEANGLDPGALLQRCDSRAVLESGGGLLPRRATGTNVQDLRVILVGSPPHGDTA